MSDSDALEAKSDEAVTHYILKSTVPLLADAAPSPWILGTGTLFEHEGRHFIVTAAHILKTDANDLSSPDIDLSAIACPTGLVGATIITLGSIDVFRPAPPSNLDVVVLELKDDEVVQTLKGGWTFLGFDTVDPFPAQGRFLLTGFLYDGRTWDGRNIGQRCLKLATDPLDHIPTVNDPEPQFDRFFLLRDKAEMPDGSLREIPPLPGMSGASLWSFHQPAGLWSPEKAVKIVAVQSSYMRGKWFRCFDWEAVRLIFRTPEVGLRCPP